MWWRKHFLVIFFMTFIQKNSLFSNMKYICSEFLTTFSSWKLKYNQKIGNSLSLAILASLARNLEFCLVSRKTSKVQEIAHYNPGKRLMYSYSHKEKCTRLLTNCWQKIILTALFCTLCKTIILKMEKKQTRCDIYNCVSLHYFFILK